MTRKTMFLMRVVIILFIMIIIPYIQNAGAGPVTPGISFFMRYYTINEFPQAYLYIVTMGMIEGVMTTIFIQSLLNSNNGDKPTQFELN